jgi:cytochrome c551/c552
LVTGSYHAASRQEAVSAVSSPQDPPQTFLNQYCVTCHNDRAKTAGLSFNTLDLKQADRNAETWEKVIRKLVARTMPPAGRPRPSEAAYDTFLAYLQQSLDRANLQHPDPGRTPTFHRLNRVEYRNAVRNLLALDVEDIESLLPRDEESFGFDNVNTQALPPSLMERYVAAAEKVSRRAIGLDTHASAPKIVELRADLTQEQEMENMPFGTRGGVSFHHTFPQDANYEFEIRLSRDRDENVEGLTEPHQLELSIDGARVEMVTVQPSPSKAEDAYYRRPDSSVFTFRIPVKAGPHDIAATFLSRPAALSEQNREPFLASFNIYRHPRMQPAIYRVAVAGPFDSTGPGDTPSRRRVLLCQPANDSQAASCARSILATLARRAYRRPIANGDVDGLMKFFEAGRSNGGFEAGIQAGLAALLVSPEFLFRIERDPPQASSNLVYRISPVELASRLSFFLWSSIPDDELLRFAEEDKLKDPQLLEQQVRRMLADPRSEALMNNFAAQWLQLRNLDSVNRSPRLFPDFDDNLRQAFRRETELFFQSMVSDDRSVLDLLRANYTFLNERLAKHYGIPNVYGSRFRRVELGPNTTRGGLLGQASFLAVTAYDTRTAPTLRGKWILENILGSPPPPAPPNIPALKETSDGGKPLSMRERMAQHRDNPSCAGCHQMMDPLGFALENFDAMGRWRDRDEGIPIDSSGALPGGEAIAGLLGLKSAVLKRPEPFLRTFTGKLLIYALGRGLDYHDETAIRQIVSNAQKYDYRFSDIVLGIVESLPFQMRRTQ